MRARLLFILICSILDLVLTLHAIHSGAATEANPLMAAALSSDELFILTKVALTSGGLAILWTRRAHQLAIKASYALAGCYTLLMIYHAVGLVL